MRKIFHAFCGLLAATSLLTSCLNSDDVNTSYYDDMAITAFTLGTLNRYLHTTTSEGKDSVYKTTYKATDYKMSIDHIGHRIYNADSLPMGTDASRVICNVTTKNSGVVYVKSLTSDTLTYLNSGSDSIDFSQPRVFRVFSIDGSGYRDYTVSLRVRSQEKGVFSWTEADLADFPVAEDYTERTGAEAAGLTYLGRTSYETYAMSPSGLLMESADDGETWTVDSLETTADLLPRTSLAYVSWILDYKTDYALLVGQTPNSDKAMTIWRKLADDDGDGRWVYMPLAEDNPYYLPKVDRVSLVYFNKCVLAFCSDRNIYVSRDQGITWKTTSTYSFPVGCSAAFRAVADDMGNLWLTDTVSGKTWRGRLTM